MNTLLVDATNTALGTVDPIDDACVTQRRLCQRGWNWLGVCALRLRPCALLPSRTVLTVLECDEDCFQPHLYLLFWIVSRLWTVC